jgi:hypothetical protein
MIHCHHGCHSGDPLTWTIATTTIGPTVEGTLLLKVVPQQMLVPSWMWWRKKTNNSNNKHTTKLLSTSYSGSSSTSELSFDFLPALLQCCWNKKKCGSEWYLSHHRYVSSELFFHEKIPPLQHRHPTKRFVFDDAWWFKLKYQNKQKIRIPGRESSVIRTYLFFFLDYRYSRSIDRELESKSLGPVKGLLPISQYLVVSSELPVLTDRLVPTLVLVVPY